MPNNCAAIVIAAKHHELTKVKDTRGTTHTVGALRCRFDFRTDDWMHSAKTAMFCKGDALLHPEVANDAIAVPLDGDDECAVPYEVLVDELPYSVGVWGVTDSGLRIVSRWLVFGAQLGCYTDGNAPADPEPTIYEQILSTAQQAVKAADAVTERANSGEFIGASAYQVAVQQGYDGTEAEWLESLVGDNGVGIIKSEINTSGELVITYSDGKVVNLGVVVGKDGTKITIDDALNADSTNPVQNKVVTDRIVRVESGVSAAHTFAINAQETADQAQGAADKAQETARLAGEEAYGVKSTIYYDISPRIAAVEKDVEDLKDGSVSMLQVVVHDIGHEGQDITHTTAEIYEHVKAGGTATLWDDRHAGRYALLYCSPEIAAFGYLDELDLKTYSLYGDGAIEYLETTLTDQDAFESIDITMPQNWSEESKETARNNIGVLPALIVTVNDDRTKASHTAGQIYEHFQNGGMVLLADGDWYYSLSVCAPEYAGFAHVYDDLLMDYYDISEDGAVAYYELGIASAKSLADLEDAVNAQSVLVVTVDEQGKPSHSSSEVFNHMASGGLAVLNMDGHFYTVSHAATDSVYFVGIWEDGMFVSRELYGNQLYSTNGDFATTLYVNDKIAANAITVDEALDANSENPVQNKVIAGAFNEALKGIESQFAAIAESLPPDAADSYVNNQALVTRDGKWVISDAPVCTKADLFGFQGRMDHFEERLTGLETTTGEMASSISGARAIAQSANTTANTAKSTAEAAQLEALKANNAIGSIETALDDIIAIQDSLIASVLPNAEEVGF